MRNVGKYSSLILLIVIFIIGIVILFAFADRMDQYLKLCTFVVPPLVLLMGGVAATGVAKVIKGEKTIDEVTNANNP